MDRLKIEQKSNKLISLIFNLVIRSKMLMLRFNRTVRYDWLNQDIFYDIEEVQEKATKWLWNYNNKRPNMGLGGITPRQKIKMLA